MSDEWYYIILDTMTHEELWFGSRGGVSGVPQWTVTTTGVKKVRGCPYLEDEIEYFKYLSEIDINNPMDKKFPDVHTKRIDATWVFLNSNGLDNIMLVPYVMDDIKMTPIFEHAFWLKDI